MNNVAYIEHLKGQAQYLKEIYENDPTEQNKALYFQAKEQWQNEAKKGRLNQKETLNPIEKKAKEGRLKQEKKPHEQFKLYEFVK